MAATPGQERARAEGDLVRQDCAKTLSLPIESQATRLLHESPLALLLRMLLEQ
jgi:hypothetical protein